MTLDLPRDRRAQPVRLTGFELPAAPGSGTGLLVALMAVVQSRYGTSWETWGVEDGRTVRYETDPSLPGATFAALAQQPPRTWPGAPGDDPRPWIAVLPERSESVPAALGGTMWAVSHCGAELRVWYDQATLAEPTARRMAEHLALLLGIAAETPDAAVQSCELLTAAERDLLRSWNPPKPDYPKATLHQLFREQAARSPERPALRFGDTELTYRELDELSEVVAHRVRPSLTGTGGLVVLSGERSLELFTSILGVLKAGAGFVYLDPALPAPRAEALLRLTAPDATLRTSSGHPLTDRPDAIAVERIIAEATGPVPPLDEIAHDGSTAYVIFTSGTTGEPKGVVRPHRLHTSRIHLEQRMYGMGQADRHLLKSPISFREFLWPLASGGTAVIAQPGLDRDDRYLADLIDREGITTVSFVPSMLRLLVEQPAFRSASALRHVFVGGEPLAADLEARIRECGYQVHNTYTLTEADYVCHRRGPVEGPVGSDVRTVVGRALDMHVYLCDPAGHLVPPGAVGEIRTGGPGLADGYLGRPDLTAERFVPNTVDPDGPPVLFRTGDLARHRADGQLEYVGRADAQVKVRGQRVEPAEVEIVLRTHPAVANAAVTGVADPDQGALLVAYVVPRGSEPSAGELREFVRQRLPEFMVPSYIAFVPALPLQPSGKVDRAKLNAPARTRPDTGVPFEPPATPAEQRLAGLVAGVLGLDEVGMDDDFFALGGDSLRLMLLRGAVESATGAEIDLAEVLAAATPRGLVQLVHGDPTAADVRPEHSPDRRSALLRRRTELGRRRTGVTSGGEGDR
ncbi:amino acid adenylation domain-containing protein [Saccharothrix coeruleofusca]|uniref:non-ribosomal peptide synthetase n=1 Tax=Saccharothrix coeruleofusca TaxID=33919 RepID=UPI001AE1BE95|nr:non-ribosomal peptide synthetase [Saccharothrix coeruleofusca]MBP2335996.1 amino acid adenylation domain-containing protein [Saccharothrix coeruleofusca]